MLDLTQTAVHIQRTLRGAKDRAKLRVKRMAHETALVRVDALRRIKLAGADQEHAETDALEATVERMSIHHQQA